MQGFSPRVPVVAIFFSSFFFFSPVRSSSLTAIAQSSGRKKANYGIVHFSPTFHWGRQNGTWCWSGTPTCSFWVWCDPTIYTICRDLSIHRVQEDCILEERSRSVFMFRSVKLFFPHHLLCDFGCLVEAILYSLDMHVSCAELKNGITAAFQHIGLETVILWTFPRQTAPTNTQPKVVAFQKQYNCCIWI